MVITSRTNKLIFLFGALFLGGCGLEEQASYQSPYKITIEETAYMVGCIEMGQRAHIPQAATLCADMSEDFLKRHRRPGET
jgi:hypothetical protein